MSAAHLPFPVRYRRTRPWGPALDVLGREIANGAPFSRKAIVHRCKGAIDGVVLPAINKMSRELARMDDALVGRWGSTLEFQTLSETALAREYAMFAGAGAQIFAFDESITGMLLRSDVDGVPADALHVPFSHFFLDLEKPIPVPGQDEDGRPYELDGLYVRQDGTALELFPVSPDMAVSTDPFEALGDLSRSLGGRLRLDLRAGADLQTCVREAIAHHVDFYSRRLVAYGERLQSLALDDDEGRGEAEQARHITEKGLAAMKEQAASGDLESRCRLIVALVANMLCYVTAYRDAGSVGWASGTPTDRVAQLERATSDKRRGDLERKLLWDGYRKVVLFGSAGEHDDTGESHGSSRAAHWRRGHWRMQQHGPRNSLRRLTWVRPCIVGGADAAAIAGHVYSVSAAAAHHE